MNVPTSHDDTRSAPKNHGPNLTQPDDDLGYALFKAACACDALALMAELDTHGTFSDRDPAGHVQVGRMYLTQALAGTLHELTAQVDSLGYKTGDSK